MMAKKMVLVPHDFVTKMSHQRQEPSGDLDSEMKRLMDSSQLDDRNKWAQYQQVLQRYLRLKDQERQPFKIELEESRAEAHPSLTDEIIESVPKNIKRKAKLLLQRLEDSDDITWDRRGEVTIKGQTITGSNITDLVGDVVRARKTTNPLGWQTFTSLLKAMNVPREFIGNPRRIAYMTHPVLSQPKATPSGRRPVIDRPYSWRKRALTRRLKLSSSDSEQEGGWASMSLK